MAPASTIQPSTITAPSPMEAHVANFDRDSSSDATVGLIIATAAACWSSFSASSRSAVVLSACRLFCSFRFLVHARDLGRRRRQPDAIAYFGHALELVGLELRVEIALIVQVNRHRIDVAFGPGRQRQPGEHAECLFHAIHDVNERPALRNGSRARKRRQNARPKRAQNAAAFAAQLGARRCRGPLGAASGLTPSARYCAPRPAADRWQPCAFLLTRRAAACAGAREAAAAPDRRASYGGRSTESRFRGRLPRCRRKNICRCPAA